jgi:hypothetical protein
MSSSELVQHPYLFHVAYQLALIALELLDHFDATNRRRGVVIPFIRGALSSLTA